MYTVIDLLRKNKLNPISAIIGDKIDSNDVKRKEQCEFKIT